MSMERWNSFRDMEGIRNWMDRFFEDNFGQRNPLSQGSGNWTPAVDLVETEQGYELSTSIPGFKPEDIQIDIDRDVVTIRGETRSSQNDQRQGNYIYRERRSGSFYRQVRLPQPVDQEKVQAYLEHGELRLELPRATQSTTRRVQVQGTSGGVGRSLSGSQPAYSTYDSPATQARSGNTNQVKIGQEVYGSDNNRVGKVKEVKDNEFLVDRPMQPDISIPYRAIKNTIGDQVTLNLPASQAENQNWSTSPQTGESGYNAAQPS